MRSNPTRVEHTFNIHDYGFIQPGSVNNSFPMLTGYYQSTGLYPSSSSLENEENEEFEGESSLSNELSDCSDVSANSSPTAHDRITTPVIDVRQYWLHQPVILKEWIAYLQTWKCGVHLHHLCHHHHLHHLCVHQHQHIQITYYHHMLIY